MESSCPGMQFRHGVHLLCSYGSSLSLQSIEAGEVPEPEEGRKKKQRGHSKSQYLRGATCPFLGKSFHTGQEDSLHFLCTKNVTLAGARLPALTHAAACTESSGRKEDAFSERLQTKYPILLPYCSPQGRRNTKLDTVTTQATGSTGR